MNFSNHSTVGGVATKRAVKVLQIVAAPAARSDGVIGINGPERRAANLVGQWRAHGISTVIAYPRRGLLWDRFVSSGEKVEDFEIGSKWAFHRVWTLMGLIRRHRIQVVHTQGPASLDLIAALAAKLAGVPLVVTRPVMIEDMITYAVWRRVLYQSVDQLGLRLARRIVAVSTQGAQRLGKLMPDLRPRIQTIRNGVELGRFTAVADRRAPTDSCVVGMTAQLTTQKAWPDFIAVIEALRRDGLPARGLIVGSGPLREELERRVRELRLDGVIEFAGFCDDVAPLLARMDVFLFTSSWEGLSVAVIEAMAAGLPVVATDVAAIREQVEPGHNGQVCPAGDIAAMASACARLLRDPNLRHVQGHASSQRARQLFAESRMLADHVELYHQIT